MLQEATLELFNSKKYNYEADEEAQNQINRILNDISTIDSINILRTDRSYRNANEYVTICLIAFDDDIAELDSSLNYLNLDYNLESNML